MPVRIAHLVSIWTVLFTAPSRYNWLFQYYLRAEGIALSWVGSGRIIMSHNFSDAEFDELVERFVRAGTSHAGRRLVVAEPGTDEQGHPPPIAEGDGDRPPAMAGAALARPVTRGQIHRG